MTATTQTATEGNENIPARITRSPLEKILSGAVIAVPLTSGAGYGFCRAQGIPLSEGAETAMVHGPAAVYGVLGAVVGVIIGKTIAESDIASQRIYAARRCGDQYRKRKRFHPDRAADAAKATAAGLFVGAPVGGVAIGGIALYITAAGYALGYIAGMLTR